MSSLRQAWRLRLNGIRNSGVNAHACVACPAMLSRSLAKGRSTVDRSEVEGNLCYESLAGFADGKLLIGGAFHFLRALLRRTQVP